MKYTAVFMCLLLLSCAGQTDQEAIKKAETAVVEKQSASASTQEEVIQTEHAEIGVPTKKPQNLLQLLNSLDCPGMESVEGYHIHPDTIKKYRSELSELDEYSQKQIEHEVRYCFRKIRETERYGLYILVAGEESHYSAMAKLVSISKSTSEIDVIDLAYLYLSEMQEEFVAATFTGEDEISVQKKMDYRYIHGIGATDSTRTEQIRYLVDDSGSIKKTHEGFTTE